MTAPRSIQSRRLFAPRRGTEVLELALLLLPLLWMTFGAIDFGYYFYLQHNLQGAASAGARAGTIPNAGDAQITEAINLVMQNAGITSGYTIDHSLDTSDPNNEYLTVTVTMPYTPIGIPPARVPNSTVKGVATMRVETLGYYTGP